MTNVTRIYRLAWTCPLHGRRQHYSLSLADAYAERSIERAVIGGYLKPTEDLPEFTVEPVHVGIESNGWTCTAATEDYDGPGSPIGYAKTQDQAIINLLEELNERSTHCAPA